MKNQNMTASNDSSTKRTALGSLPNLFFIGLSLLVVAYWIWVWSTPLWHPDDYMLATRSNLPFGQFLWADILRDAGWYFWDVNGRLSDSVTQMALASLPAAIAVAVILHLASAIGTYVCVRFFAPTVKDSIALIVMVLCFAFPFALIRFDSLLAADLFHFYAATVSTLGGYCCAVWTVWLAAKAQKEGRFGGYFWSASIVFLLTGFMHELAAFFLIPALTILIATRWKTAESLKERLVLLPLLSLVLARLSAPGMWRRVGVVNENFYSEEAKLTRFDRLIMAFSRFFTNPVPLIIVFLLLLFLVTLLLLSAEGNRLDLYPAGVGTLATFAWTFLGMRNMKLLSERVWNGHHGRSDLLQALSGVLLFLMVAVACVCATYCAIRLSHLTKNWLFSAVFFGAMTTALIPLSLGNATGRQVFFLEAFMYVMLLALVLLLVTQNKKALSRVGLVCGALLLLYVGQGVLGHTKNLADTFSEYSAFTSQVEAVQAGTSTVIDTRVQYSHPHIFDSSYMEREDMREAIPLFYGLDPQTEVLLP